MVMATATSSSRSPLTRCTVYRGKGDFTFYPPVSLFTRGGGYQPADVTSGDFNGDGRRDLAVVSPGEIDIFINPAASPSPVR